MTTMTETGFRGLFLGLVLGMTVLFLPSGILKAGETAAEAAAWPANPGLEDYLRVAREHRPALAAARDRAEALRAGADRDGALPPLKFAWGEMIVPVETRVGPQQRVFSVSQSIPWFGTLGLKSGAAEAEADAAVARLAGRAREVERDVRAAWLELAYLHGAVAAVSSHLDLAVQAEEVTRRSYEAGEGSYADLLTAQIELGRIETRLAGLRDRVRPAVARLGAAAGLEGEAAAPTSPELAAVPAGEDLPDLPVLEAILEAHNPELAVRRHELESRRRRVDLAGKSAYPDLALGLDYIMTGPARMEGVTDSGRDPVIARVAVSIPLWGGQADARRRNSAGMMRAADAELADARLRLKAELETAHFALRDATRREALYSETMITRGRQALDVTTARYAAGQAGFQDLIEARRTLLDLELSRLRAATDRRLAWNDLITLLGTDPASEEG